MYCTRIHVYYYLYSYNTNIYIYAYFYYHIIGKSLNFLLCPDSNRQACQTMLASMRSNTQETHCIITHTRTSENKVMKNVIGMNPILDETKKLLYIISIFFDVSKETDDCEAKQHLANELLDMLPGSLLTDATDEELEAIAAATCLPHTE